MPNNFIVTGVALLCFGLFIQCKKTGSTSQTQSDTFIHAYSSPESQECSKIIATADGGILMITSSDLRELYDELKVTLVKLDKFGNTQWEKVLKDSIFDPRIVPLGDGTFLIGSSTDSGKLIRMDEDGNTIFNTSFYSFSVLNFFSFPIRTGLGTFYTTRTNGWGTGSASSNSIFKFGVNGSYYNNQLIPDTNFGGKVYILNVYNYTNPDIFYLCGLLYQYPFNWANNPRIFVAKIQTSSGIVINKKVMHLDSANISNFNFSFYKSKTLFNYVVNPDSSLVIASIQQEKVTNNIGHLICVDKNLDKKWDLNLALGEGNTVLESIFRCADGNYLICGSSYTTGKSTEQPFAGMVSRDGKLLWSKIYTMSKNSSFNSAIEKDGFLYFGGTTNSFGGGFDKNDVYLMKTDRNGNFNN